MVSTSPGADYVAPGKNKNSIVQIPVVTKTRSVEATLLSPGREYD
jgi:hypothetical protein